jgi:hypothetical protein
MSYENSALSSTIEKTENSPGAALMDQLKQTLGLD